MNLHITTGDKFLQGFISNQKQYVPVSENLYYHVQNRSISEHCFTDQQIKVLTLPSLQEQLISLQNANCKHVIFHSLPTHFQKYLLPLIRKDILITWIFYGYEYYHRRNIIEEYLQPRTKSYYRSFRNPNLFQMKVLHFLDFIEDADINYQNDLGRINRFAHWNIEEYKLIKDRFGLYQMEFVPFSMGARGHLIVPDCRSNYLLLGHSGAITVNHLDGLQALKHQLLESFDRVIIPMSYGANKSYKARIEEAARNKLGDKAIVIDKFIDRDSYFNLLSRVKLAWMPQLRGMAGGNALFCLRNNIPIVMPEKSIMFKYFKAHGVHVFSMDHIICEKPMLSEFQMRQNQAALDRLFGKQVIRKQYQDLLAPI